MDVHLLWKWEECVNFREKTTIKVRRNSTKFQRVLNLDIRTDRQTNSIFGHPYSQTDKHGVPQEHKIRTSAQTDWRQTSENVVALIETKNLGIVIMGTINKHNYIYKSAMDIRTSGCADRHDIVVDTFREKYEQRTRNSQIWISEKTDWDNLKNKKETSGHQDTQTEKMEVKVG